MSVFVLSILSYLLQVLRGLVIQSRPLKPGRLCHQEVHVLMCFFVWLLHLSPNVCVDSLLETAFNICAEAAMENDNREPTEVTQRANYAELWDWQTPFSAQFVPLSTTMNVVLSYL